MFYDEDERKRANPGEWIDGRNAVVRICDMTNRHLLSTIAYVERTFRETQDIFRDDALDIDLVWPEHTHLLKEAVRRGLIASNNKNRLVTG